MARTQTEVFNTMLAAKAVESSLSRLTSQATTAIWRLILWVCAGAISFFEGLHDQFKTDVQTQIDSQQVGNLYWYQQQILNFQLGDNLVFSGGKYRYAVIDAAKKIVARCAILEENDPSVGANLRVKVAKANGTDLVALTNTELTALTSYLLKIRFAGTRFQLFTNNGDVLRIALKIYYDPIIGLDTIKINVEKAINDYIQNLEFDGQLAIIKLIDALQKITGVLDVELLNAASKFSAGDAYQSFTRVKVAGGGYFKISTTSGETLADTLSYEAVLV
jgi:hypothetical protein